MSTPSTVRDLLSNTDIVVAARRVRENDCPVTRAALRGAIRRTGRSTDIDKLVTHVLFAYDAALLRDAHR